MDWCLSRAIKCINCLYPSPSIIIGVFEKPDTWWLTINEDFWYVNIVINKSISNFLSKHRNICITQHDTIFISLPCWYIERIVHYKIILQENSSGFILRSFSNSASLCSLSFLMVFSNFSEGLLITIGSFVYDITTLLTSQRYEKFSKRRSFWADFFAKVVLFPQKERQR